VLSSEKSPVSDQKPSAFARLLREPLLHFIVIGGALFVLSALVGENASAPGKRELVVSAGQIAWLEESFAARWMRPPTPEERQGLIDALVRETVLYREALAMGLDEDDVIVRRRLAQKLEFLFQDLADAEPPTEDKLRAHFDSNRERYQDPAMITLTQVYVDPDRHGETTGADAKAILAKLSAQDDPMAAAADAGDRSLLPPHYPDWTALDIAKLFGNEFAQSAFELEPGQWHGPVVSGYGVHLVYIHDRTQPPPPTFDAVRKRVAVDWQDDTRQQFNEEFVANLLSRYEVIIEHHETEQAVSAE
jgi:hypothetical protein